MNYIEVIKKIEQASREKKILKIIYIEKDGISEGWRHIEPYSFSEDDGEKGLFAWDISKGGIRRFSLDRITQIEVTEQIYTPRYPIKIF